MFHRGIWGCVEAQSPTYKTKVSGMFLDHCLSLLNTGSSEATKEQFNAELQVLFKLSSGVTAKRLDSHQTALLMIEAMKAMAKDKSASEQHEMFDHFVKYVFETRSEPVAMALVKYAIADRKLVIKKMAECSSWKLISSTFKPVMLDNSKDPKEQKKYSRFLRVHERLKHLKCVSDTMKEYLEANLQTA